jgi:gluconokinase
VDLGSSSVRAIVFETVGPSELAAVPGALARRPRHLISREPGQATFDAADYLSDLVACVDELQSKGFLDGVSDVALDCQWHSVLAIGPDGRPETDVVSWADTRPQRPRPGCTAETLEGLRQRTGCAFAPMYWTWRVPWLRANGPARAGARSSARFVGLSEYVGLGLLGDPSMSVSMASATGLLATGERGWDEAAFELAGIAAADLPDLAPFDWEGQLTAAWRRRWPELAAARWHPAMGDGAAANLGVGCDVPSRAAITIGTSAAVRSVRLGRGPDLPALPAGLWRYCVDYERTVTGAAYSSGGQLYAWALSLWEGAGPSASAPSAPGDSAPGDSAPSTSALSDSAPDGGSGEEAAARTRALEGAGAGASRAVRYDVSVPVKAGSEGVLVLPWHAGTRPPAPLVPAGRGAVVGLGLGHSGAHIVSAAVEAVCFQLAGGLADLEAGSRHRLEVVLNGGAIEGSPWWIGRLAATLGRRVLISRVPETTARGAAVAALGVGAGAGGVERESIEPEPADVVALLQARQRWDECYETLLPIAASHGA